jgi:hypothetical protein
LFFHPAGQTESGLVSPRSAWRAKDRLSGLQNMAQHLDKPSRDRLAAAKQIDEIEITEAMIKAGADAFWDWRSVEDGSAETGAYCVFKAMILASSALGHLNVVDRSDTSHP